MLVVAHMKGDSCAMSLYNCDVERIESIPQRPPRLLHMREIGYFDSVSFSPKGNMLSFEWHPDDKPWRRTLFSDGRVAMADFSALKDAEDGSQIRFEVFSEISQWERFASS